MHLCLMHLEPDRLPVLAVIGSCTIDAVHSGNQLGAAEQRCGDVHSYRVTAALQNFHDGWIMAFFKRHNMIVAHMPAGGIRYCLGILFVSK